MGGRAAVAAGAGVDDDAAAERVGRRDRADDHALAVRGQQRLAPGAAARSRRRGRRAAPAPRACRGGRARARCGARRRGRAARRGPWSATGRVAGDHARRRARPRRARRRRGSARRAARRPRGRPARRGPARTAPARRGPTGSTVTRSPSASAPAPQRAGHHRPGAAHRERAVDVQHGAARHAAPRRSTSAAAPSSAARRSSRPCPDGAAHATVGTPGSSSATSAGARAGSATSVFVIATTPVADVERAQDRRVLARLRHHPVVGGDDHQEQVDARRPGDHRAHEPLVARHVDDRQRRGRSAAPAARTRARSTSRARVSSGSRSVSVPVSARTSAVLPWSMCPAVPRVSGTSPVASPVPSPKGEGQALPPEGVMPGTPRGPLRRRGRPPRR